MKWLKEKKEEIIVTTLFFLPIPFVIWFVVWTEHFSPLAKGLRELGL